MSRYRAGLRSRSLVDIIALCGRCCKNCRCTRLACMSRLDLTSTHITHFTLRFARRSETRTQAFAKSYTQTQERSHIHKHTHPRMHAETNIHKHTHTPRHTHTHRHTHTYGSSGAVYGSVGRSCSPLVNPINTAMILFICGNSFKHVDFNVCT